jgi:chromosome segregation protein
VSYLISAKKYFHAKYRENVRLKQLHIKGFKSFADKTVVNLDNQITGIVGPNGCGKSNIVDAIRWVIGEHKIRNLRSQSLQDLIFNGSKARNSSGLAEVALTFENTRNLLPTEFNTVTIGRKFYKNGDSEYRLNDVSCRLKDINNLFMDTGVSSDSYAIIELGMVDEIIKDKDNSRRRMLEQAAGISIYKTRKKEAQNKLKATEQDLNRIEDLLFEIKNNLRTLENQAKKAEKYLTIKDNYKEASIEFAKASLEDFNTSYQSLNVQEKDELDKILSLDGDIGKENAELEQRKSQLVEKENQLQQLQKKFNELKDGIRSKESDKSLSMQRLDHLSQLEESIKKNVAEANVQIENLKKSLEDNQRDMTKHNEGLQEFKEKIEAVRKRLEEKRAVYDERKKEVDDKQSEHQQLQVQGFDAEKLMAISESEISNYNRSIEQLNQDNQNKAEQIKNAQEQLEVAEKELAIEKEKLNELLAKREEASNNLLSSQEKLEDQRNSWMNENRKLDAKKNEHQLIKDLVEKLEGFPESIKYLKNNNEWGIDAPLLSDVFTVDGEYASCIESYLDKYLSYYVVENRGAALKAIELLKEHKKGKVGFFILSEIQNNASVSSDPNAALNKIKADEKYSGLLESLLGKVVIKEALVEQPAGDTIYLHKNGEVFATKNALVGGFKGVFENNKIGRTQRLESVANEINLLESTAGSLKTAMDALQQDILGFNNDLNEENIKNLEQEINQKQIEIARLHQGIENFSKQSEQATERIGQLKQSIVDKNDKIALSKNTFHEAKQQLNFAFDSLQSSKQKFEVAEAEYNRTQEEYNTQNIILTKQQSKLNELEHERKLTQQQLEDTQLKIKDYEKQEEETQQQLKDTQELLKNTEENLYNLLQQKETEEKGLNEQDQAYYNFRNELNEYESALNKKRRQKEQSEGLLNSIKDKLNEMKLQLTSMKERLHIEFKVDLDAVLGEERTTEDSLDDLTERVEKLKKRIFNLGEVNPMAVEAFQEMKSRYDFIEEQRSDLLQAKENLLQTILEVEENANQKFLDTFEAVRKNFIDVFKALFTEDDDCDMKLTDPDDPAETGIEIYAQPKGKNPKTITQLSGGEKTLTSTAFLFAIYLIKPAPFCVLDEVDAPLDDANVGKFMKMIRQFSDKSQFIIVTHNKQTMSQVDVIYGVTMQEAGVSKLVPVDFRSLEDNMFA